MDASPFSTIPPEVRNRIYELVVHAVPRDPMKPGMYLGWYHDGRCYAGKNYSDAISITRTCRQMRAESRLMVYAGQRLSLYVGTYETMENAGRFLQNLGLDVLKVLSTVNVTYFGEPDCYPRFGFRVRDRDAGTGGASVCYIDPEDEHCRSGRPGKAQIDSFFRGLVDMGIEVRDQQDIQGSTTTGDGTAG